MSLRYAKNKHLFLFTLLAAVKASNILFIAYMIKDMLNVASSGSTDYWHLIRLASITCVGQLLFMSSNFVYETIKMTIIREVNLCFKSANLTYLIDQGEDDYKSGLSLMTNDLKQLETNRVNARLDMILQGFTFVGSLGFALYNSWQMTLVFLVATIAPALVQLATSPIIAKRSATWVTRNADYTQHVSDSLNGGQMAKIYNVRRHVISRAMGAAGRMETALRNLSLTQAWALELIYSVAELFSFVIPCTIGGILMMQGQLAVGTLVMMVDLAMNFITPVVTLFNEFNQVMATKPMWVRTQRALAFRLKDEQVAPVPFTGLELANLSYVTHGDQKQLFQDVNLIVKPGEKVLLMAPSSWGKTTLLHIMLGLRRPASGQVCITGQDVTGNWERAHQYFSYVNQKPFMFDDTLRFNLTLGRSVSDDTLFTAMKQAGLAEFATDTGLQKQVGEDGSHLSGGQIQRVEFARALISKRPIILADEATSALDPKLSLAIHQVLLSNPEVAVLEVAHKISDQERAMFDQIVHLNQPTKPASRHN